MFNETNRVLYPTTADQSWVGTQHGCLLCYITMYDMAISLLYSIEIGPSLLGRLKKKSLDSQCECYAFKKLTYTYISTLRW